MMKSYVYLGFISIVFTLALMLSCTSSSSSDACCVNDYSYTGTLDSGFCRPNVITPNSDGFNDALYLCNLPANSLLQISDLNDKLLYSNSAYANDFIGVDNTGSIMPEGKYLLELQMPNATCTYTLSIVRNKPSTKSCHEKCVPHDDGDPLLVP